MKWILGLLLVSGIAFGQNNNINTNINNNGNGTVSMEPITINNDSLGECYDDCRDELLYYLDGDEDDDIDFVDLKCRKYCNLPKRRPHPKPKPKPEPCDNDMCIKNKNVNKNSNTNLNRLW